MGKSDWKYRWKHWVRPTRLPGIWKMQEGGHIARARVIDPTTGRMKELKKVFPQSNAEEAFAWLEAERTRVRSGTVLARPQKVRFADYAISVFERKVRTGELKSAATQSKWRDTLVHLVRGTHDADGELAVSGFVGDRLIPRRIGEERRACAGASSSPVKIWRSGPPGPRWRRRDSPPK